MHRFNMTPPVIELNLFDRMHPTADSILRAREVCSRARAPLTGIRRGRCSPLKYH